jgi:hypothetical protein
MARINKVYFYRLHKESNGQVYCKIWKWENGKAIYVRSLGTADKINQKLEHYEKITEPNQEK